MMNRLEGTLLEGLRRVRRPFAWLILVTGLLGMLATFPLGLTTEVGDTDFWVTLAGFFLLTLDGYDKVTEVEFDDDGDLVEAQG